MLLLSIISGGGHTRVAADEENILPGLHCLVTDGKHVVTRIDWRPSFDWTGSRIESRIADVQSVTWSGNLLVRSRGRHTFHAQLAGAVQVIVNDQVVLAEDGANVFVSGTATDFSAGDHRIQIVFKPKLKDAGTKVPPDFRMQLFWSSPDFTLEPIPADVLTHAEEHKASPAHQGRMLVDAHRCAACHSGLDELPTLKAPSLQRLRGNTSNADIVRRLTHPETVDVGSLMPAFEFSESEAKDVAEFLFDGSEASGTVISQHKQYTPEDIDAGQKLLLTTGCVVCHATSQLPRGFEPQAAPYHGPDLSTVTERRSAAWLATWLKTPQAINPEHRMPIFTLTEDEQRQIVAALLQKSESALESSGTENVSDIAAVVRGRELVLKANCAACHRISGIQQPKSTKNRPFADKTNNAAHDCIAVPTQAVNTDAARLPRFQLNAIQREKIRSWLVTLTANLPPSAEFARGELLLHRHGCVACHDRDEQTGLSAMAATIEARRSDLRGQSPALIPPPLTAVGDRLRDDYLFQAVAGEHQERRLPWLLVRMPRFEFSPEDRQSIVRYFVGSDRIPESADVARRELFTHLDPQHPVIATTSDLLLGNQLAGAGGFNCIACHTAGLYEPRHVAIGTRGSNIMTMGQRVRSRYFMRWMRNPIRVVPGIEMPAIRKPVSGLPEESLSEQIAVLWKALADPKFSPPTVASRYEQFVTLSPGDSPRVIRDVFTIGNTKEHESVARAFAVGFNNGQNLLLDLDAMQLRQWTIGEFARQRTEGKSWYWDLAGVTLMEPKGDRPFVSLMQADKPDAPLMLPVIDERRQAELLSYRVTSGSVSLRVRFYFDLQHADGKPDRELPPHSPLTAWNDPDRPLIETILSFELKPFSGENNHSGWTWDVVAEECPAPYALQLGTATPQKLQGEIPGSVSYVSAVQSDLLPDAPRLTEGEGVTLKYLCHVKPLILPLPPGAKESSIAEPITAVPGFEGRRLPIGSAIMPTGMAWLADGRMVMSSLKGDVWILSDTDNDELADTMAIFADGLSAPYGIQIDGDSILVAHKPELLRMRDTDGDGRADEFKIVASGWGFSDDYHDWTTGLARNHDGDLFVGLGSDYSQNKRAADNDRWRGAILKIDSIGHISPIATAFRFPMGLAFDRKQNLFATDNQGVQNTFNEINHVILGKHYGVPSRHAVATVEPAEMPAVMVPHPWTRSVNSLLFFPDTFPNADLAGHGIGCEYDTRCLIRFTLQEVHGVQQGACYRFSRPDQAAGGGNFVGPVASAIGRDGALYIGSIWDSGWQGGANTGCIERLTVGPSMPNGIREIRATVAGFEVTFFQPLINAALMSTVSTWSVRGSTRLWSGSYATPDSERYSLTPTSVDLSHDRKIAMLNVQPLKAGFVYEIGVLESVATPEALWPAAGFYSMKAVP